MGVESFGNYENPGNNEQKESLNYDLGSLNDSQNKIELEARNYVLNEQVSGRDVTELISDLNNLVERHRDENETLEKQIISETKEGLDKEALINEAKIQIYEKCGINENQEENSAFENFSKGFIDEMILGNYDMAVEVINTNGKILLGALEQLASWEGLKQMAQALGESVWNLFTGDAYERGKSIAELGLVATGVGLGVTLGKKGLKLGMKQISKLRVNKELLVDAPDIKNVVGETRGKVDDIVPKKQFDFESMIVQDISKLGDTDRIDAGKSYLGGKDLIPEQEVAIIKAHEVGIDRDGAGINNYNQIEISEKARILKEAGFTKQERKLLMEKGVCDKEVETDIVDAEFINNRMDLSDFDNLSDIEKLEVLGLSKEFSDLVNNSGFVPNDFDLIERYKELQYGDIFLKKGKPIDYQTMINNAVEKLKDNKIDKIDAMLLFASTDKYLFHNINGALRGIKELTDKQALFLDRFDQALEKMPDLEGRHIIRGDSHYSWLSDKEIKIDGERVSNMELSELIKRGEVEGLKQGDQIPLNAYTYIADQTNDVFLGKYFPKNDTLIIVKGDNGGIKDISSVSLYKNFGDRLPGSGKTTVEGIIERGTEVEFIDSRVLSNAVFNDGKVNKKVVVVRVKNK